MAHEANESKRVNVAESGGATRNILHAAALRAGRAGDGFGSLRWVAKRRYFELRFQIHRVRRSEYFSVAQFGSRTAAEHAAKLRRRELAGRSAGGSLVITRSPTVAEFAEEFAEIRSGITSVTAAGYEDRLRHVVRRIGRYRLKGELTGTVIDDFYRALIEKDGKSPKLVRHVHSRLTVMLDLAVSRGIIPQNPIRAEKIRPPKAEPGAYDVFTADEIARIMLAAEADHSVLEPAVALMAYCALRPGELLALRWSDMDLTPGMVTVSRSIGDLRTTKTRSGRRTLPLPPRAIAALTEWKERPQHSEYVFPGELGKHLGEQSLLKQFHALLDRIGVRRRRCYDLRHTAITHAMAYMRVTDGVSIADVALWAGHSKSSTTLDNYTHLLPASPGVILAMARAYGPELGPLRASNDGAATRRSGLAS